MDTTTKVPGSRQSDVHGPGAIILAAGKGTRMASDLPKVVHPVAGRPMICHVVEACLGAGCAWVVVVVGHGQEHVRAALEPYAERGVVRFAVQDQQLGTGHAVLSAASSFDGASPGTPVFVLAGDGPLIRASTLRVLLARHRDHHASATLATSVIADPTGYGRIVRDARGRFERIVEHKSATPEQLAIREVNPSYYCFELGAMLDSLRKVERDARSGEYYLTDVPSMLLRAGSRVEVIDAVPPEDVLSINTPAQLSQVDRILRSRQASERLPASQPRSGSMPDNNLLKVFAGRHSRELAERICQHVGQPIGEARTFEFPDGELLVRLEEDVRGRDCFVVISTCDPVNDNLVELLIFIDCLKRASARRVTIVAPYFGYGRQDRKDKGRVPITAKLVANLITAARADRVLALDLHAAQIQGFFDIPVDHLSATPVFIEYFRSIRDELGDLCLVSPDVGNVKVAESFANLLHGDLAIINKRRVSGTEVVTEHIIGSVRGKTVLMFDDMISTGGTICEAAKLVMEHGARGVIAAATHGVLCGNAAQRLADSTITKVVVTNTIPCAERCAPLSAAGKLTVLCVGPLLGEAIRRIHHNLSLSALFQGTAGVKR